MYQQFAQLEAFTAAALPLLHKDPLRNTLCLSQIKKGNNSTLSVLSCSSCATECVLVADEQGPGTGYSAAYVSAGACSHIACRCADLLQKQLQQCDTVTLPAAAATLLRSAQTDSDRWPVHIQLQLMQYGSSSLPPAKLTTNAASAARATTGGKQSMGTPALTTTACVKAPGAPTTAGVQDSMMPTSMQHAGRPVSTPAPAHDQPLLLRQCAEDKDLCLLVSWSAAFLQEVFHKPERPPVEQVQGTVLHRLQQGCFYILTDDAAAVSTPLCLVSHTPTTNSSTRITMVYTPPDKRGRGYASTAVQQLVHLLHSTLGFSSICLMADKDKPRIGAMYQGVGFVYVDELQTLKRPRAGAAKPSSNN